MMKKLMIAAMALVMGGFVLEAKDLVSLGIYFSEGGSVELVEQMPKVVYRGKNVKGKGGYMSFPCYINIDKPKSVELKFKADGDVTVYASLYAFHKAEGGNSIIPVVCNKFEYNGKSIPRIPGVIKGWKRMLTRRVKDGEIFTISIELEKADK